MTTLTMVDQRTLSELASLYDYPEPGCHEKINEICEGLKNRVCPAAAAELEEFVQAVSPMESTRLEEIHTYSFSLTPLCVPYIGVQLLGENNFKRGEFLGSLSVMCQLYAIDEKGELPDHIATMLCLASQVPMEDLTEMLNYCLLPGMKTMVAQVENTKTPYKHLVVATAKVLEDIERRLYHD